MSTTYVVSLLYSLYSRSTALMLTHCHRYCSMDDSPFGELSAELRNMIYRLVLIEPYGMMLIVQKNGLIPNARIGFHYDEESKDFEPHIIPRQSTALLRVCQQMREETRTMYFSLNKLSIGLDLCIGYAIVVFSNVWCCY